jgi:large subunit ribosomal protein L29
MNARDLRKKGAAELKEELLKLRREQFNLRMAAAAGQPARPDQHGKVRRNVARVKTVLSEIKRSERTGSES